MTLALDQSILELLHASREDEQTIDLPVSDRIFGFNAQQAAEKLLKSLIGGHEQRYQFTHDLGVLIRHASALGENLPISVQALEFLTGLCGCVALPGADSDIGRAAYSGANKYHRTSEVRLCKAVDSTTCPGLEFTARIARFASLTGRI